MRTRKRRLNMFAKIMALCVCVIAAAIALQTALFQSFSTRAIYGQTKDMNARLLESLSGDVYARTKAVENGLIAVYAQKTLMHDLYMHEDHAETKKRNIRCARDIADSLGADVKVAAVYVYDDFNRIVSVYRHASTPAHNYPADVFDDLDGFNARPLRRFMNSETAAMLVSGYYNVSRERDIVRFALNIFSQDGARNQIGCVVCDVDSGYFTDILDKYLAADGALWLQTPGDRAVASVGATASAQFLNVSGAVKSGKTGGELESGARGQVLFKVEVEKYGIELFSLMRPSALVENQRALNKSLVIIAAALLICCTVASFLFARGITRPLTELTATMRRIESGETRLRARDLGGDEIGELGETFNTMLDRLQELAEKEYMAKSVQQRAQYNALQAQINPHFLHNTLDTMSGIAQIQNCDMVSELCESLSDMFRYALDMSDPFSTLEKELVHLKNYIYVMDVRLNNSVFYSFDIQEEALDCRLPRLTLQPITENALTHGLRAIRTEKRVELGAHLQGGALIVTISDNGVGMNPERLNAELEKNDLTRVEKGDSIGLHNINARIKLLFGGGFGVRVASKPGEGTRVTVTLPAMRGGVSVEGNKL